MLEYGGRIILRNIGGAISKNLGCKIEIGRSLNCIK